jgi:hypothetical protein
MVAKTLFVNGQGWFMSDHELGIDPGADQAARQGGLFRYGIVWLFGVIFMAFAAAIWRDRRVGAGDEIGHLG